jgi:hypothetical protein
MIESFDPAGNQTASPSTTNGVTTQQLSAAVGNTIVPISACAVGVVVGMASLLL